MWKYIVSALCGVLTILFACLQSVWAGFSYFALAFGCVLCLLWAVLWIVDYFITYKRENLEERYNLYCAYIVNTTSLSLDIVKKADKVYYKKFKRTLIKEKLVCWIKIFFAVGFFVALFFIFF